MAERPDGKSKGHPRPELSRQDFLARAKGDARGAYLVHTRATSTAMANRARMNNSDAVGFRESPSTGCARMAATLRANAGPQTTHDSATTIPIVTGTMEAKSRNDQCQFLIIPRNPQSINGHRAAAMRRVVMNWASRGLTGYLSPPFLLPPEECACPAAACLDLFRGRP